MIGNRPAARRDNLLDHVVGWRDGFLLSRKAHAEIVDHHRRALSGQRAGHSAADTTSAASDGGNFTVKLTHRYS